VVNAFQRRRGADFFTDKPRKNFHQSFGITLRHFIADEAKIRREVSLRLSDVQKSFHLAGGLIIKIPLSDKDFGHESRPSQTGSGWPVYGGWPSGASVILADWEGLESERYKI
jgi:hypothetical protein